MATEPYNPEHKTQQCRVLAGSQKPVTSHMTDWAIDRTLVQSFNPGYINITDQ